MREEHAVEHGLRARQRGACGLGGDGWDSADLAKNGGAAIDILRDAAHGQGRLFDQASNAKPKAGVELALVDVRSDDDAQPDDTALTGVPVYPLPKGTTVAKVGEVPVTYAAAGIPLNLALISEVVLALGCIPLAAYGTPGTPELSQALSPLVAQYDAVIEQRRDKSR